jgi:phosphoribosylformylglycinamidine synthase I
MADVRVLIIRAAGINCDEEMLHCWNLVGARPRAVHINRLAEHARVIREFQVVVIPGGFSYGDDVGAGVILAQRLSLELVDELRAHVERGGGVLGVCNGFQALVKAGLLPGEPWTGTVTVTHNDSGRFEARWVRLQVAADRCPFLAPGSTLRLPVEHGEGKVATTDAAVTADLFRAGCVALRYVDEEGRFDRYPANPNGSDSGIAGLCDVTGRVFGLMPHPDRCFDPQHRPDWTPSTLSDEPDGLTIFRNAMRCWR